MVQLQIPRHIILSAGTRLGTNLAGSKAVKWSYYYNPDRSDAATNYRRVKSEVYQQLKAHIAWGYSDPMFIKSSHRVPDLLLVLKGYPT